jgi:hypothetical protein
MQVIRYCKFVALGGEGVGWRGVNIYLSDNPSSEKMRKGGNCLTRLLSMLEVVHEQSSEL